MPVRSAGIMLVRTRTTLSADAGGDRRGVRLFEMLIAHMGGPYFARRDAGAWTIPKGHVEEGESIEDAARRELHEETGVLLASDAVLRPLGTVRLRSGKIVHGFAVEHDVDDRTLTSQTVEMEWPPRSGNRVMVPELDQYRWCSPVEARRLLHPAQAEFVDRALAAFDVVGSSPE
jgi:predicted NUDIX family NTP pyrophosphohydrolase